MTSVSQARSPGRAKDVLASVTISQIYRALTGREPRRTGSGRWRAAAVWRGGEGFNVSLSDEKGCWYDFVTGDGGGVLDLVLLVRGGNRAEALQYLADLAGVRLDRNLLSCSQKRAYAVRRARVESLAQQCAWWASAYIQELEKAKAAADEHGDIGMLAWSGSELYLLQTAISEVVMARFLAAMDADPVNTARFVAAGREDERQVYGVALLITNMIMEAAQRRKEAEEGGHGA